MFEHSVKVPRHYKIAANIFKQVSTEGGSVKTLLYDDKLRHFRTNVLFALITETIKHTSDIDKIFENSKIFEKESRLDPWLAKILTSELLFGKKALPGKSKPEQTVLSYKDQFEKYITDHQDDLKTEDLISTLISTMADSGDAPFLSQQTKRFAMVLGHLLVYSIAMFTLPFATFFGVRHVLTTNYPGETFLVNVWSVASSVVVVNIIIGAYVYKAYHEKEFDEDGNEIDQHAYPAASAAEITTEKSTLNLKHD